MDSRSTFEAAVYRRLAKAVGHEDFEPATRLRMLGLQRQALEDLLFRLEDDLDLNVSPRREDQFIATDPTVADLIGFLMGD